MPYKSSSQRKWMHVNEPALAKKWDAKYGGKISKKKMQRARVKALS